MGALTSCLTTLCQSPNCLQQTLHFFFKHTHTHARTHVHTQILSYLLLANHGFGWPLSPSDQFQPNRTLFHHDLILT
ncbi:hypothetical protein L1987_61734 [Smallanthus sonchifolius]|uniref:Uncharacterized protein n=1 Tax=Smallanthus sonchifolius TaxID=185202 RepID=A0ACB9C8Q4_9ASTR|nr:hypothetical protein L1987_61734 [Smallanthus sonchifolius]